MVWWFGLRSVDIYFETNKVERVNAEVPNVSHLVKSNQLSIWNSFAKNGLTLQRNGLTLQTGARRHTKKKHSCKDFGVGKSGTCLRIILQDI